MESKQVAYAMDFASFLIQKMGDENVVKNIILFGSVARGEAKKESDIDIFIDVTRENKKIEENIKKNLSRFLTSAKCKDYWAPLGIDQEFNLIIGKLKNWKELKTSIMANGILLYGTFKPEAKEGKYRTIFVWENVKPNSTRVLFNKQLFGHNHQGKKYSGMLEEYHGLRLGKGCIIVPPEHSNLFHHLFKKHNVSVKIKKIIDIS